LYNFILSVYQSLPFDSLSLARAKVVPLKHPNINEKGICVRNDQINGNNGNFNKIHNNSSQQHHTGTLTFPQLIPKQLIPYVLGHDHDAINLLSQNNKSDKNDQNDKNDKQNDQNSFLTSKIPLSINLPLGSILYHNNILSFDIITTIVIQNLSIYRLYQQKSTSVLNNREIWSSCINQASLMVTPYQYTFLRPTPQIVSDIIEAYSLYPDLNYPIHPAIALRGMRQPLLQSLLYSGMPFFAKKMTPKRVRNDPFNFRLPTRWDFHHIFISDNSEDIEQNDGQNDDQNEVINNIDANIPQINTINPPQASPKPLLLTATTTTTTTTTTTLSPFPPHSSPIPKNTPILTKTTTITKAIDRFLSQPRHIVNIDEPDRDGLTLLARLVLNPLYMDPDIRLCLIKKLLQHGASPFVYGKQGIPLIHSMLYSPTLKLLADELVTQYPALSMLYNHHGLLPIHLSCSLLNAPFSPRSIQTLIKYTSLDQIMLTLRGQYSYPTQGYDYDEFNGFDHDHFLKFGGYNGTSLLHMLLGSDQHQYKDFNRYINTDKGRFGKGREKEEWKNGKKLTFSVFGKLRPYQRHKIKIINTSYNEDPKQHAIWDDHIAVALGTVLDGIVKKIILD